MEEFLYAVFNSALTLIAVMNPFGNVPLFMGLTEEFSEGTREKIYNTIVAAGFGIVLGFGLIGHVFMEYFFKVGMEEVRIAGGMILIVVAFNNLLFSKKRSRAEIETTTEEDAMKMGVTPLAFPMLVGPGTMATAMILKQQDGLVVTVLGTIITFAIIKVLLMSGKYLEKILGKLVLYLLSRIMQIFIMAVGVRLLVTGISEVVKRVI
ncbi:UPF0056 inner membrane protein [Propionigenium maris DSM 9537]|uniref:UPF0056 membrane protein n=1 Tax=Propionigenium maris DSM 9537 TaxID=1123000 RepID=A0A9W6LMV1_9FUSO|nr:MarC family protein [Propionigenium maris]GLI56701.1 UPF0056 inner membrane protein [Propionigenium maris DSM 9537]